MNIKITKILVCSFLRQTSKTHLRPCSILLQSQHLKLFCQSFSSKSPEIIVVKKQKRRILSSTDEESEKPPPVSSKK